MLQERAFLGRINKASIANPVSKETQFGLMLKTLLDKGQTVKVGRIAGAFRNTGNPAIADEIIITMKSSG